VIMEICLLLYTKARQEIYRAVRLHTAVKPKKTCYVSYYLQESVAL
jgi:hypothetical protein